MTDFPVMNSNPPAMALLALLRVCGVEPTEAGDGLRITPRIPDRYVLDVPLIKIDASPNSVNGEYRPIVDGGRVLYIYVPDNAQNIQATINSNAINISVENNYVPLSMQFNAKQAVSFSVTWEVN